MKLGMILSPLVLFYLTGCQYINAFTGHREEPLTFAPGPLNPKKVQLKEEFGGRRVTWSGRVYSKYLGEQSIAGESYPFLEVKMDGIGLFVSPAPSQKENLKAVPVGDRVTFTGIVSKESGEITVHDSVIVSYGLF